MLIYDKLQKTHIFAMSDFKEVTILFLEVTILFLEKEK